MTNTIGSYLADRRKNNFDFIRLVAAALVVFSHSFPLTLPTGNEQEPLMLLSGGQITLGNLSVIIFFVVSGFLITQSYAHSQNLRRFLIARALRIFPALAVIVLATVFVLGPLVSASSVTDYFSNPKTYTYLTTILLHPFGNSGELPAVFEDNVYKSAVNGSLWTLEYEFLCYLAVAFLGVLKILNKPFAIALLAGAIVIANVPGFSMGIDTIKNAAYFMQYFSAGMLFFLYRDRIVMNGYFAAASFIVLGLLTSTGGVKNGLILFGSYLIFYLAFHPGIKLNNTSKYGDFSYGLYIYAFPIQQLITMYLYPNINPYTEFLIALPLTLLCAMFSWHVIEKKALSNKYKGKPGAPAAKEPVPSKMTALN